MLGPEKCDDLGYADLLKSVAETGDLPTILPSPHGRGAGGEGGRGEGRSVGAGRGAGGEGCRGEGSSGDDQGDGGLPAMIARGLGITSPLLPGEGPGVRAVRSVPERSRGEGDWTPGPACAMLDPAAACPRWAST